MDIIRLNGTDGRLYSLVAPLVMNPAVLRQNNNYPFKTSHNYTWYIAVEDDVVVGFMPVKDAAGKLCIDNYYIRGDAGATIDRLLACVTGDADRGRTLIAVVHKRHVNDFVRSGFRTFLEWKNYDKMEYNIQRNHGQTTGCV